MLFRSVFEDGHPQAIKYFSADTNQPLTLGILIDTSASQMRVRAGINDFGGISPVSPDYINPRHPWPHLAWLTEAWGVLVLAQLVSVVVRRPQAPS